MHSPLSPMPVSIRYTDGIHHPSIFPTTSVASAPRSPACAWCFAVDSRTVFGPFSALRLFPRASSQPFRIVKGTRKHWRKKSGCRRSVGGPVGLRHRGHCLAGPDRRRRAVSKRGALQPRTNYSGKQALHVRGVPQHKRYWACTLHV